MLHGILDDANPSSSDELGLIGSFRPPSSTPARAWMPAWIVSARRSRRGVPVRLYIDNGKIYRSPQLARMAASIWMLIVHTPPYQPEARGKIERFFQSLCEQFRNNLDHKRTLSLDELNERL
jgi:transposase InsO family protein